MAEDNLSGKPIAQEMMLGFLRLLMKLLLRFEITNIENIPSTGPLLVITNHIAFLDPLMVLGGFPRLVIPLAKKEVFVSVLWGPLVRMYGAISVHRETADVRAIKSVLRVLKNGGAILLAPEGTRSPTGQMQTGKDGAVMIALRSGATIVPVGITGTDQIEAHWIKLKRAPVQLSIGQPFRLRLANERRHRPDMKAMTEEMMYRLAAQLPAEFRGVYRNLEEATESYLVPVEG